MAKLARSRRGAVAAEFGLVMPLFISMFMGMVEYSFVYFTYGNMQAATRDVTRQLAVNTLMPGQAEAELKRRMPPWASDSVTVSVNQSAPSNPATNVITMTTDLPIAKATPIGFFTKAQTTDISSSVEMKQELPFVEVGA
ncbi:pilus assembly protein [Sandaracinobacter sp. RS1-74]|uniref:TadE/TadG family type IV pilus assembly protein n=1 Tax=Sandaracinobacteroides sayramensis TaxID=2913411 RepID=UPI001EDC8B7B|nr:TadE/TadG family type IV pilus assembly protein [Sandaracinobacteroides sayramensis]MCG2840576.1 pilus assembly protein [Sandaracinobacteroides sayramensis]